MPQQFETESTESEFGAHTNLVNRNPAEWGVGMPGVAEPHVELEADYHGQSLHLAFSADEAEDLGVRLIAHAAVLRLP